MVATPLPTPGDGLYPTRPGLLMSGYLTVDADGYPRTVDRVEQVWRVWYEPVEGRADHDDHGMLDFVPARPPRR